MYTYHALFFPSSDLTLVTLNAECEIVKAGILGRKVKNAIFDRQKRGTKLGASLLVRTIFPYQPSSEQEQTLLHEPMDERVFGVQKDKGSASRTIQTTSS